MSKFLRRSLQIFIIKGFRTIVFIFIVISTTFLLNILNYHYYYYHYYFTPWQFFTSTLADGLSLKFAVFWMVSIRPRISKSSSPFINPLVTVSRTPIIIGINVTFMFYSFFNSLAKSRYLSFFSLSFNFILWSAGRAKSTILQVFFIFCYWLL